MSAIFGELLTFPQAGGPDVRLRTFGDEHYARYENIDGYSVVYDDGLGLFCYARLAGNRFVSTGVASDAPPPAGVVRHLQESAAVKRATVEERELLRRSIDAPGAAREEVVRTFGPNQGLLSGRVLSIGAVRGLTILVNFQDVTSQTTAADVDAMLNADNFSRNGNICSVRQYFRQVSNGQLDYTNTVVGPFTLSKNREHYITNLLVREALELAVAAGVNLADFDSRGEGIVDAVNILYAGRSIYQKLLWPHNSTIHVAAGGVRTNLYLLTGLGSVPSELSIGTFCHENGHLLCRFPDMYDYGERDNDALDSAGIGHFCLMGAGNHLDNGRSPAPVCAYLRDLAGWCTNVVDLSVPGTYKARHADYGTVLKHPTSKPNEYFIVENRSQLGLDRACPSSGLAIYHCDIFGSNELQQGTADAHYQCALLQADGRRDLENNLSQGDGSDLFGPIAGLAVTSTSNPHTREWDGRESGLVVADIAPPGVAIEFKVGTPAAAVTFKGDLAPDAAIPDNRAGGISSTIRCPKSGIVRRIQVSVAIKHPYIGDLTVELVSPSNRRAVLHARQGRGKDDLIATYDSDRPGELSTLRGQPMKGDWVLRVADRARDDVGRLKTWGVEVEGGAV